MSKSSIIQKNIAKVLFVSFGAMASNYSSGKNEEKITQPRDSSSAYQDNSKSQNVIQSPQAEVTDLKFGEFFKMPIGPRGLEPTQKLISLIGKRVRLTGFMVLQQTPPHGFFIFSPLPVALGDGDESLADDLPASTVYVHTSNSKQVIPHHPGMMHLTGILQLGPQDESDGHVSLVRLQLDHGLIKAMLQKEP